MPSALQKARTDGMHFPSLDGEPRRSGRDVSGGSAPRCSLRGPRGGMLLLARFGILEVFPSVLGIDPVSRSIPIPAGAMAMGATVGKRTHSVGRWSRERVGRGLVCA